MVKRLLYGSATILGVIAAASVAGLMITVIADTAGRFFFSTPIPGANDYSRYWWMILIVFGALVSQKDATSRSKRSYLKLSCPPNSK